MTKPLFMWAGGKSRMLKHYGQPPKKQAYYEPFFGGGAMFLQVMKERPAVVHVNDINAEVIGIYKAIQNDLEQFLYWMDSLSSSFLEVNRKKFYYDVRNQYAYEYESWGKVRESATLYFLMKTCFNGIFQINKNTNGRFGTPCGLLNQKESVYDRENVRQWNRLLQGVTITAGDWKEACPVQENAFYFLDPPYRGCFTSYGQTFGDERQEELIAFAKLVPDSSVVMLCNRDVGDGFFEERQGSLKIKHFDVIYTAGRRKRVEGGFEAKKAREVLLWNI